jgi:hypothetical protein
MCLLIVIPETRAWHLQYSSELGKATSKACAWELPVLYVICQLHVIGYDVNLPFGGVIVTKQCDVNKEGNK